MDWLEDLKAEQASIRRGEIGVFVLMATASLITLAMMGMALYDAGPALWHRLLASLG